MTTPGGVPNLPAGALTLDDLASKVQDMSGDAMKGRAVARMPSVFNSSTGLNPALDFTPFGLVTRIYAEVMSLVANADPADINGPEDLPELVRDFIEGIPLVGQFVGILEAIIGTYDGEDEVLLQVQQFFAPVRALMQLFAGIGEGLPNVEEITAGVQQFLQAFQGLDLTNPGAIAAFVQSGIQALVEGLIQRIIDAVIGGFTHSTAAGNVIESLQPVLALPLGTLQAVTVGLANLQQTVLGLFANLSGQVAALQATNPNNPVTPGTALGAGGFDNFNRPAIGPSWTSVAGTLAISDGRVQTETRSAGLYTQAHPATDKHGAAVTVNTKFAGRAMVVVSSNAAMTNFAALEIYTGLFGDDAVRLVTGSSPTLTVVHDSVDMTINDNWCFAIRYDPDTNEFIGFKNAEEILRWEDENHVVEHGEDHRFCGIVSNVDGTFFARGFGLTDFTYYDFTSGAV